MTIDQAFRNRGLLVPEGSKPVYRITYGNNKYDCRTIEVETTGWKNAKQELNEKWREFAADQRIREDSVLGIHCIRNVWQV